MEKCCSIKPLQYLRERELLRGFGKTGVDAVLEGSVNNYRDSQENVFSPVFAGFLKRFDKLGFGSYERQWGILTSCIVMWKNRSI